jgi:hypothetical protein
VIVAVEIKEGAPISQLVIHLCLTPKVSKAYTFSAQYSKQIAEYIAPVYVILLWRKLLRGSSCLGYTVSSTS